MLSTLVILIMSVLLVCPVYIIIQKRWHRPFISSKRITNKVVIVTGANTGIGYETAKELSKRAGRVILACRDINKAQKAADEIKSETGYEVVAKHLDLASFKSIRAFAKDIIETEGRVDILINNAATGVLNNALTEDHLPIEAQVNYFGPFLLTMLLLPGMKKLEEAARIINVSSTMHLLGTVHNLHRQGKSILERRRVYANSKLALILFTQKLASELIKRNNNIIVNCCHPGAVFTGMFRDQSRIVKWFLKLLFLTPQQGAQTSVFLAVQELNMLHSSGKYYANCQEDTPSELARDPQEAQKLWDLSLKICFNKR